MPEPTGCVRCCARTETCANCDLLVGLPGLHVIDVADGGDTLILAVVTVESPPSAEGCRVCGVVASSHGRRLVSLVDVPCFGRPVRLVWRKRTWRCAEPLCPARTFTEQHDDLARPRALLTRRACWPLSRRTVDNDQSITLNGSIERGSGRNRSVPFQAP